jgi:RsiW-degrading membrane proteinase PrsW (M82 family)
MVIGQFGLTVLYQRIGYFQLDWPISSQMDQFDNVFMKLMILVIIVFGVLVV